MASNGPVEPSADNRAFAANCFQMFTALRLEGFDETQALSIVGTIVQSVIFKGDTGS